jgi:hypothetical protein
MSTDTSASLLLVHTCLPGFHATALHGRAVRGTNARIGDSSSLSLLHMHIHIFDHINLKFHTHTHRFTHTPVVPERVQLLLEIKNHHPSAGQAGRYAVRSGRIKAPIQAANDLLLVHERPEALHAGGRRGGGGGGGCVLRAQRLRLLLLCVWLCKGLC